CRCGLSFLGPSRSPRRGPAPQPGSPRLSLAIAPAIVRIGQAMQLSVSAQAGGRAVLRIQDVGGRDVGRRVVDLPSSGERTLSWDPGSLQPGGYFLSVSVGRERVAGRFIALRERRAS